MAALFALLARLWFCGAVVCLLECLSYALDGLPQTSEAMGLGVFLCAGSAYCCDKASEAWK